MNVYFIQSGKKKGAAIKIGWAANVQKRLEHLQIGNPAKLHLLAQIKRESESEAKRIEAQLHSTFERQRIRGEWFNGNIRYKKFLRDDEEHS